MIPFEHLKVESDVRYAEYCGGLTRAASTRARVVGWLKVDAAVFQARARRDPVVLEPGGVLRIEGAVNLDLPGENGRGPTWFVPLPAVTEQES